MENQIRKHDSVGTDEVSGIKRNEPRIIREIFVNFGSLTLIVCIHKFVS